jgi:hypothetical protein
MKAKTRGLPIFVLGAGLLAGLAVLAPWVGGGFDEPARAQGPVTVGFDMDPTGNSCPGDGLTNCTLGTIDTCKQVDVSVSPAALPIDVFLEALPPADSILGFGYTIDWGPPDFLDINTQTNTSPTVNLLAQQGGFFFDASDVVPDTTPPHRALVVDYGPAEYNPPYTHGALGRCEVTVPMGTPTGLYGLTLGDLALARDVPPNGYLCVDYGCTVLDANSTPQYGLIAVNRTCPTSESVGGIAELPHVPGSSRVDYAAQAGALATAVVTATAGAWYARRRWLR